MQIILQHVDNGQNSHDAEKNFKKRIDNKFYEKIDDDYCDDDCYNRAHVCLFKTILIINPIFIVSQSRLPVISFCPGSSLSTDFVQKYFSDANILGSNLHQFVVADI